MAPVALNVALLPTQIAVGLAVTFKVGVGVTDTVNVAVREHPDALVPVTVYVVVVPGVTTVVAPVNAPGIQV